VALHGDFIAFEVRSNGRIVPGKANSPHGILLEAECNDLNPVAATRIKSEVAEVSATLKCP
jgi:hypothetical protein